MRINVTAKEKKDDYTGEQLGTALWYIKDYNYYYVPMYLEGTWRLYTIKTGEPLGAKQFKNHYTKWHGTAWSDIMAMYKAVTSGYTLTIILESDYELTIYQDKEQDNDR